MIREMRVVIESKVVIFFLITERIRLYFFYIYLYPTLLGKYQGFQASDFYRISVMNDLIN